VSARLSSNNTGSSTCVARHPVHRDRRGTTRTSPLRSRTEPPWVQERLLI
jgi:hypothetical protein